MALPGAAAKPAKLGHSPTAEWADVPDVAFAGPWPVELPKTCGRKKWHDLVVAWWAEVRVMPHCVLWTPTDWRFALETCYMKQQLWLDYGEGDMKSTAWTEVRRREDQMGYTVEARRKLRIRYVDPNNPAVGAVHSSTTPAPAASSGGNVIGMQSRRDRIANAG